MVRKWRSLLFKVSTFRKLSFLWSLTVFNQSSTFRFHIRGPCSAPKYSASQNKEYFYVTRSLVYSATCFGLLDRLRVIHTVYEITGWKLSIQIMDTSCCIRLHVVHTWRWGLTDRIQKVGRKTDQRFETLWLLYIPNTVVTIYTKHCGYYIYQKFLFVKKDWCYSKQCSVVWSAVQSLV
jgi:hypothetical protein